MNMKITFEGVVILNIKQIQMSKIWEKHTIFYESKTINMKIALEGVVILNINQIWMSKIWKKNIILKSMNQGINEPNYVPKISAVCFKWEFTARRFSSTSVCAVSSVTNLTS